MDVTVQKEYVTRELIAELEPLLNDHWAEVEIYESIKMDPDWPMIQCLQDQELFYFYTARANGELLGYIGYIVSPSIHYKHSKHALCDLVYVRPQHRGRFLLSKLLRHAEQEFIKLNVINVGHGLKIHHDFGNILSRQGYHLEEHYYSKRIQ